MQFNQIRIISLCGGQALGYVQNKGGFFLASDMDQVLENCAHPDKLVIKITNTKVYTYLEAFVVLIRYSVIEVFK